MRLPAGTSFDRSNGDETLYLKMYGRKLYNYALTYVPGVVKQSLERAGSVDPSLDMDQIKGLLALSAKSITVNEIVQAEMEAKKPKEFKKIEQAWDLVADGDAFLADQDYLGAVESYQEAQREVQGIGRRWPGYTKSKYKWFGHFFRLGWSRWSGYHWGRTLHCFCLHTGFHVRKG